MKLFQQKQPDLEPKIKKRKHSRMSPSLIMITITVAPSPADHTPSFPSLPTPACCINVFLSPGPILFLYSPHIIRGVQVKYDMKVVSILMQVHVKCLMIKTLLK